MYSIFYISGFMVKEHNWPVRVVVRTIVVLCTSFVRLRADWYSGSHMFLSVMSPTRYYMCFCVIAPQHAQWPDFPEHCFSLP